MSTVVCPPAASQPTCRTCGDPAHEPGQCYRDNCGDAERITRSPMAMAMDTKGAVRKGGFGGEGAYRVMPANTHYRTS